ncbi:MAG TPA: hypothetical protein VLT36_22690 [Candidatus Dormibacteraeota bacterium]|nr:hypothetical protein [Candidatus Dormibacteraeota bacterium]
MHTLETKTKFMICRAQGWSLARITDHLHVSKTTLEDWNRDMRFKIEHLCALHLEEIREEILHAQKQDPAQLQARYKVLQKELAQRNLEDVTTEKLCSLEASLRADIESLRDRTLRHQYSWSSIPGPETPAWWFLVQHLRGEQPQVAPLAQTQTEPQPREQSADAPVQAPAPPTDQAQT